MAQRELRALFVGGPMYDGLYTRLGDFEKESGWHVEVAGALPHPELNARIDEEFGSGEARYDLISTHTKYAPAQRRWLTPLDRDLGADELAALHPGALELARIEGALYGVPRNLDVKLLYYRTDLFEDEQERLGYYTAAGAELAPPETWDDFRGIALYFARGPDLYGFAFPGRDSGLFGHFFELQAMAGGRLLDDDFRPAFEDASGRWALDLLASLYREGAAPPQTPDWHYDEVAQCFRRGEAAMTTDWPGGFYSYTEPTMSSITDSFGVALYPIGPAGRHVYAGSHTFAIPVSVGDREAALGLLRFLTSWESQIMEARQGSLATRLAVQARVRAESASWPLAAARWTLLEETAAAALFPPRHPKYPAMEDVMWRAFRRAILGEVTVDEGLALAAAGVRAVVG